MFDGPTTPGLDFDAPIVVLDLADVYSSEALAIFMACATAFMQATLAAHRVRRGRGAEGDLRGRRGVACAVRARAG